MEEAWQWVASFADWYNHRHRHSGIEFVTPHQRHNGDAMEICRHRAVIYAGAPAKPTPVVTIHALLASTRSGVDQSTTTGT
tara:strand:- start:13759 stop:14001 length:243 start_codon:yes stop_codon:yes gene_type:complete